MEGRVVRLGLTPLKGAAHVRPARVDVAGHGAVGDRGWCCVEREPSDRGEAGRGAGEGGAERWLVARTVRTPALLRVRAAPLPGGGLRLGLPEGAWDVPGPTPDGGTTLVADYWGRPAPVALAPGPWDAALSDLVGRPVALARVLRPGAVVYADPVVLLTTSTLRELARRTGAEVDDERFRSLVLVDTRGAEPFVEDAWHGRALDVGGARLEVTGGVARCAVVQRTPGTGERAADDLLGALARDRVVEGPAGREVVLGVGARVLRPGPVAVGDPVVLRT
ncbi:MOSC domain-containing protein [uncultured Pseudokineococcus sp.]|uniref:MOSC domain-containing protein n=1 Tax=uncultured Pseudokineococcus sp. TaxID=1642928 RepID=UPI002637F20E|nr:MOSC domain-containing protein [uncultured Pseudokineococcus sp.]